MARHRLLVLTRSDVGRSGIEQQLLQLLEHARRGGEHVVGPDLAAGEIGEAGAGFRGDEQAGGRVPRLEADLEVGVDAAGADEAEVDGGGAEAADVADLAR